MIKDLKMYVTRNFMGNGSNWLRLSKRLTIERLIYSYSHWACNG